MFSLRRFQPDLDDVVRVDADLVPVSGFALVQLFARDPLKMVTVGRASVAIRIM